MPAPDNSITGLPPPPRPVELEAHATDAARLLKALANPHRLLILCLLFEGEKSVGQLNEKLPLAQSALSQHLAVLRRDGLVTTRRESQTIHYSVSDGATADILGVLHRHYCA